MTHSKPTPTKPPSCATCASRRVVPADGSQRRLTAARLPRPAVCRRNQRPAQPPSKRRLTDNEEITAAQMTLVEVPHNVCETLEHVLRACRPSRRRAKTGTLAAPSPQQLAVKSKLVAGSLRASGKNQLRAGRTHLPAAHAGRRLTGTWVEPSGSPSVGSAAARSGGRR